MFFSEHWMLVFDPFSGPVLNFTGLLGTAHSPFMLSSVSTNDLSSVSTNDEVIT